jgi:hypothetical protein
MTSVATSAEARLPVIGEDAFPFRREPSLAPLTRAWLEAADGEV